MNRSILALSLLVSLTTTGISHEIKEESGHGTLDVEAAGAPRIEKIEVVEDPVGGFNLYVVIENFEFAPELVNQDHAPGKGHAHIYVDGVKIARLYGPAYHIEHLSPGERHIAVTLNANDHRQYAIDQIKIVKEISITVK